MKRIWSRFCMMTAAMMGVFVMPSIVVVTIGAQAFAQEGERDPRASQTLTTPVAKQLGVVFELMTAEKYTEAFNKVNGLIANRRAKMPPYDLATCLELRGSIAVQLTPPQYDRALRDFKEILTLDALPLQRQTQLRLYVAQLLSQKGNYTEALGYILAYVRQQENAAAPIDANIYFLLAGLYYQTEQMRAAIRPAEKAVAVSEENNKPEKRYFRLLSSLYLTHGSPAQQIKLLRRMVTLWPEEENFWATLSSVYATSGRDADAAATLEMAYRAGLIGDEKRIIPLAQYYSMFDNPYRGAKMLEREMATGTVKSTVENLVLLSQLWNLAREQKKAIPPLTKAAEMSPNGKLFYRLGQVYFADEQWARAEQYLRKGIKAGLSKKETGDAWLLIGSARYNNAGEDKAKRTKAKEAFEMATRYKSSKSRASGWVEYITKVEETEHKQQKLEEQQERERINTERAQCRNVLRVRDLGGSVDEERTAYCEAFLEETG